MIFKDVFHRRPVLTFLVLFFTFVVLTQPSVLGNLSISTVVLGELLFGCSISTVMLLLWAVVIVGLLLWASKQQPQHTPGRKKKRRKRTKAPAEIKFDLMNTVVSASETEEESLFSFLHGTQFAANREKAMKKEKKEQEPRRPVGKKRRSKAAKTARSVVVPPRKKSAPQPRPSSAPPCSPQAADLLPVLKRLRLEQMCSLLLRRGIATRERLLRLGPREWTDCGLPLDGWNALRALLREGGGKVEEDSVGVPQEKEKEDNMNFPQAPLDFPSTDDLESTPELSWMTSLLEE